jgi:hypothetical protein
VLAKAGALLLKPYPSPHFHFLKLILLKDFAKCEELDYYFGTGDYTRAFEHARQTL